MEEKIIHLMEIAFDIQLKEKNISECAPETIKNWDSLTFLNFLTLLEESFNVSFILDEIAEMSAGGNIIMSILKRKL